MLHQQKKLDSPAEEIKDGESQYGKESRFFVQ